MRKLENINSLFLALHRGNRRDDSQKNYTMQIAQR